MDKDDLTLLLIAQNTRMRIACRLTTKNQTGYQIRAECDLFGRKAIPNNVRQFLTKQGLPTQNRYTKVEHLTRLLRLLKPYEEFTKDPQGLRAVSSHVGRLVMLRSHEDMIDILEVLDNDAV
tara:strand:+ start:651 stop:1016 length:366 start_codon:yes stop_codon:yes gene_type:complete